MRRVPVTPRPDWEARIRSQGFLFYKEDGYYNESAAYEFTAEEIATIERATAELYDMCLRVVEYVIDNGLWEEFRIPPEYVDLITWSWRTRQPSFYGRFDLAFNNGEVKMLEFNADTPTLLLESSVIQWHWLNDYDKELDQYNNLHEALVNRMRVAKKELLPGKLHFCAHDNMEDFMTVKYMQDAAAQAGIETDFVYIDDIHVNEEGRFMDASGELIKNIFKIYPYEWMFDEPFGEYLPANKEHCKWIEPPYKAILSNKMLLPYLYKLFPDSPYVLPCVTGTEEEAKELLGDYARKPIFSREGENVSLVLDGVVLEETKGDYGADGYVYQRYTELPEFDGRHPIIGSWIIGDQPAGMGIRESTGRITNVTSQFCPHFISE